jgi:hypothetical protein
MIQENLNEMVKNLNNNESTQIESTDIMDTSSEKDPVDVSTLEETKIIEEPTKTTPSDEIEISLTNFYDWFEANENLIHNISRVKAEVTNIVPKDSMIFKIKKFKKDDDMELVSFYNPAIRPILNLPPVYLKVFKNDTFEALHQCNNEVFIKSYGIKTGLILVYCVNIDGKIIPFEKTKVKKDIQSIKVSGYTGMTETIRAKLSESMDSEIIQLLYKQAIKSKDEFTTKENTINWFMKKSTDVIDINHLLKIDNVLINIIK